MIFSEGAHGLTLLCRVKDHGDGLTPTPASFGAEAPKLGYLRVREGAHGLTLLCRVKDWSTCAAVPERGEALLRAAEEWSAAARKCGKPDPERSGGERPNQKKLILIPHEFRSNG